MPTSLPGRNVAIHVLRQAIEESPLVGLHGAPGVGKTSLAGAVARASGRPVLAVSLLGCAVEGDVVRAFGEAVGATPCGDARSCLAALAGHPGALVVVDDTLEPDLVGVVERLVAAVPAGRALLVGELPLVSRRVEVGEPDGAEPGTMLLTRLAAAMNRPTGEAALAALPEDAHFLARFPGGLPADAVDRLPSAALVPDLRDRAILRRGLAARLAPDPLPGGAVERLARSLLPVFDAARGGHLARVPDPRDILVLRALAALPAASLPPELSPELLAAAEARLLLVAGQPEAAGARLSAAGAGAGFARRALLHHGRVELGFALGDLDSAWTNALAAADALGAAGDAAGRAVLWRRVAERLAERGEVTLADEAWRRARQASRLLGDEGGLAAALRGAASLALSRGEWVGAGALCEEAAESNPSPTERVNLRLAELDLALVRGESARLRRQLDTLEGEGTGDALLRANLWRRRADALARAGEIEGAALAADRAAGLYGTLGEAVARGAALRLGADVAALGGHHADAFARYERALRDQVRTRDWSGLVRTLDHAAALADAAEWPERARLLREQRAGVMRIRSA
jgi:tetratricopeptide (TPR) repeat protein